MGGLPVSKGTVQMGSERVPGVNWTAHFDVHFDVELVILFPLDIRVHSQVVGHKRGELRM